MAVGIAVELSRPPLLRSRFEWLREPDPAAVASPPVLIAFDLPYVKGRDISQRPLRERRAPGRRGRRHGLRVAAARSLRA
jgi:hypothetical protein